MSAALPETALLVVDIDYRDGWKAEQISSDGDKKKVGVAIENVLDTVRASSGLVLFVTLTSDKRKSGDFQAEGQECISRDGDYRLAEFLEHSHEPFEPVFIKTTNDAFINSNLTSYLHSNGVKELLLAGYYTFACILATGTGAVREGFNVTLLEECTFPPFSNEDQKKSWLGSVTQEVPNDSNVLVQIKSAHSLGLASDESAKTPMPEVVGDATPSLLHRIMNRVRSNS